MQFAQGQERAFETLYGLYAKLLYSLILPIVKQREDSEEVLQEVFLQSTATTRICSLLRLREPISCLELQTTF